MDKKQMKAPVLFKPYFGLICVCLEEEKVDKVLKKGLGWSDIAGTLDSLAVSISEQLEDTCSFCIRACPDIKMLEFYLYHYSQDQADAPSQKNVRVERAFPVHLYFVCHRANCIPYDNKLIYTPFWKARHNDGEQWLSSRISYAGRLYIPEKKECTSKV